MSSDISSNRKKPKFGTRINWGHKLAPDMAMYFQENAGIPQCFLKGGKRVTVNNVNTPTWAVRKSGINGYSDATIDGWTINDSDLPSSFPGHSSSPSVPFTIMLSSEGPSAPGGDSYNVITKQSVAEVPYFLWYDSTSKAFFTTGTTHSSTAAPYTNFAKVNYVLRWDGATASIFINGILDSSFSVTSWSSNTGPLRLTHRGDLSSNRGSIVYVEYFKYWSRALTEKEIFDVYQNPYAEFSKPKILTGLFPTSVVQVQSAYTLKNNIINAIQKPTIFKNNIINAAQKPVITKQNILNSAQKSITQKHNIINAIQKTTILKHNIINAIQKTTTLKHNIINAVQKPIILKHNIIEAIQKTVILKHNIINPVQKQSILKNQIIQAISKSLILKHNINSSIISVQKTSILKHNIVNVIQKPIIFKENILTSIQKTAILKQNIRNLVQANIILKHNIVSSVQKLVTLKHNLVSVLKTVITGKSVSFAGKITRKSISLIKISLKSISRKS